MNVLELSIAAAVLATTPILLAAVGELLGEKVGVFNVGIEGVMLMGGLVGFVAMSHTSSAEVGLVAAFLGGAAFVALFALTTIALGSDQLVSGLAMALLGVGLTGELGKSYVGVRAVSSLGDMPIPGLSSLPVVGQALFSHHWLVYMSWLLPLALHLLLTSTRHGLAVRAVGEDPVAAHAAGVHVQRLRVLYVLASGGLMGIAGGFITLGTVQRWNFLVTGGVGWIALAVVIFANWHAASLLWASYVVGALGTLSVISQALGWGVPSQVLSMAPYLATVVVLGLQGWRNRTSPSFFSGPAALGEPFIRASS